MGMVAHGRKGWRSSGMAPGVAGGGDDGAGGLGREVDAERRHEVAAAWWCRRMRGSN